MTSDAYSSESADNTSDRMWPLDLSIAVLASVVTYLIATQLSFDDARWQWNARTYIVAVPLTAFGLDVVVRRFASKYVQKSLQLGFLMSVLVHLVLLMLAINVIIFSHYFPDAFTGVKPERLPVKRTVPEYLFKKPDQRSTQPDWSQPAETETASPVTPRQQRQLPPVAHTAPQLEMPMPRDPIARPSRDHLIKREDLSESLPQPSDAPAKLARRQAAFSDSMPTSERPPVAPDVAVTANVQERLVDRPTDHSRNSAKSPNQFQLPSPDTVSTNANREPSRAGSRQRSEAMPMVGDAGLQRTRRDPSTAQRPKPAGSAPAPPAVAIARLTPDADRMMTPIETPMSRDNKSTGAVLSLGDAPGAQQSDSRSADLSSGDRTSRNPTAAAGSPEITAGREMRVPGRANRTSAGMGFSPAGPPTASGESVATAANPSSASSEIAERPLASSPTRPSVSPDVSSLAVLSMAGPNFDLPMETGPIGLADLPNRNTGVVPSIEPPEIAAMDLTTGTRRRRDVGGPITPFGNKVAAVESFSRRVMRTEGGASPTPAGMVGPATEEAIEKGLAFLSRIQNEDGSWSLQGHGTDVVLRSDTAATGLCLLAFQGAGYTHREHQYADSVSRGLKFLIDNQRTNGDLYRSEDPLSNRNVAFYSHGIAALALCEAYGMTQDESLREPAQMCLDYIAATQHLSRGGWRYSPQVSSDTSVTGWMMMALKSGQLSGLEVSPKTYDGIETWLDMAQSPDRDDRYRYNPFAPDTPTQRHGRFATPTMTAVGMLMRMYAGWQRDTPAMRSAADYLLEYPPQMGTAVSPQRDAYYWYYATQVMFHMGGSHWERWNQSLNPVLLKSQLDDGPAIGSWDPVSPVPDRWSVHAGRLYVTTMNLLNLEVYYRHLPIYEDTAE
ncbi:Prenyltransferase and squalene oxidase repeat protein [Rubripirellula lacrimiformis]|uniref:Prenyltransferase and squalene oxidase repeat protein n=1 Tax=Rubripirellula lacrimiformis TaxID=1930273 RepID=A0A517N656_9BACT|nr:prenyltransferase/squalene oxidase repeat-containing protein [Rubripirellula lacrimiformis]QDT02617.1 Prenyltransferase and squalene oxidase repeat protein [Rubripirellula lacrimiformis]